ncbi:hypothetical protein [Streptomyces sp. NPDC088789]|uniref:hypothetical protein n=1 Tax=Streptomyces sp. NPDC088789 TaxID=3365899 RepID=UPI003825F266
MEQQRIGTSSQPLDAGVNPAHIPGLTQPAPAEPEDAVDEAEDLSADGTAAEGAAPEPAKSDADDGTDAGTGADPDAESATDAETDTGTDAEAARKAADGPVFEAADRRARIVADAQGVRLGLDDQRCEFRWDEIGAIETVTPRFGKRYTITVHTPDRRWYPIEIEAKSRSDHKEWDERIDAVLDAYFEEGEPEKADDADTDADAKAEKDASEAREEPTT